MLVGILETSSAGILILFRWFAKSLTFFSRRFLFDICLPLIPFPHVVAWSSFSNYPEVAAIETCLLCQG